MISLHLLWRSSLVQVRNEEKEVRRRLQEDQG